MVPHPHFGFFSAFIGLSVASKGLTRWNDNTRSLSHSPIGTIANEFDGLKVALQRFPPGRGAGRSALSHTENTKRGNNEGFS